MVKRRGNGEGSLGKRKDGRWMGRYTVHTPEGPKQRSDFGRTRAEAAKKLTRAMADRDGGIVYDAGKLTLGNYLGKWLADSVRDTVRQRTFVQKLLGHGDVSLSLNVYSHVLPDMGDAAAGAMDKALG